MELVVIENICSQDAYSLEHSRPKLERVLQQLKLNKQFFKAEGNYLFYSEDGKEQKVLDLIGGYGSLFLGHHHSELNEYAIELLQNKVPIHSQLSSKEYVNRLADFISEELNQAIDSDENKEFITTLANTGAEAVEAALKHAKYHFSQKKKAILNKIHQELHAIDNYFLKYEKPLFVELKDGTIITDFSYLKAYIVGNVIEQIEQASPVLLAAKKSFHGKTTGALDATYNFNYRSHFQTSKKEKERVKFFDINPSDVELCLTGLNYFYLLPVLTASGKIELKEKSFSTCLGIIIEPIQGEAGVLPISKDFITFLRKVTLDKNIPLIVDEIQTGCYRTGTLCNSLQSGVYADYYLLSKSFGGGLVKNAALVVDKKLYYEEFGMVHTSTFTDDEFSSAISLRALQISKNEAVAVNKKSEQIKKSLFKIKELFPRVVKEVRGEGLMWGIEFHDLSMSASYGFQMVCRTGYLNYLYCSYLLENWNTRLAPTLSDANTLRIQPSIFITEKEIELLGKALNSLCEIVYCRDFYKLIEHILPEEERNLRPLTDFGRETVPMDVDENCEGNVGFITHFIDENGVRAGMESMAMLHDDTINQLFNSVMEISAPIISGAKKIVSSTGKEVNAYFAGLLFTANMARSMMLEGATEEYEVLCNKAVDMLQEEYQCKVVGLGQYTSVITKNGKSISNPEVFITTGNSFTVGIGVMAVLGELKKQSEQLDEFVLGVVGAGGNICSTYIKCFVPHLSKIVLKGSDSASGKLKALRFARELVSYTLNLVMDNMDENHIGMMKTLKSSKVFQDIMKGELSIQDLKLFELLQEELGERMPFIIVDDLHDLVQCKVTVVATNNPKPFLYSKYFAPDSIVYDISVPINSTEDLIHNDKNIKVIMGGVVQLPNNEKLPMKGYPLDKGEAFACISETILLGLEGIEGNYSYGNLIPSQIEKINGIGNRHNFQLKKIKMDQIF